MLNLVLMIILDQHSSLFYPGKSDSYGLLILKLFIISQIVIILQ